MSTAIQTKVEDSTDSKGRTVTSETWESFTAPPVAPQGATNIRRTNTDGKFTLVFDRVPDGSPDSGYTVEASMSQEPIETHEKFREITAADWKKWNLWKANPTDESLQGWTPVDAGEPMATLVGLYEKGITDYLVPRAVVRITKEESLAPNLSKLGKISPPAGAPTLPGDANWMLTGANGNLQEGNTWSNTYEYMSSGPAGWNQEIYQ